MPQLPFAIGRVPAWILVAALVILAFLLGFVLRGGGPGPVTGVDRTAESSAPRVGTEHAHQGAAEVWTCSMHPQIRAPEAGRCPICGMDLIPVETTGSAAEGPTDLSLSPYARRLAGIEVAPVERKYVAAEIRVVGKVTYDETRLAYITARVPGRLDRLFVDYTGIPVRAGDHLVSLYSPELLSAQEELIQATRRVQELEHGARGPGRESAALTLAAVREKLRLWGLTDDQLAEIVSRGTASDHLTIYAPMSGIVIHKDAVEGMYVQTGTRIYTIADLTQVWVKLDAYESDLSWLRYGQEVSFETEAYPGEIFRGQIAFIDPVLDARTRTVKVRVNVPNSDGRLKPEMFVRATVRSWVASGGQVMEPELAGKWICPMHPEEIADASGDCGICGMPLTRTEALGYVSVDPDTQEAPLVIPVTAPLITGKRAVVYVQRPGAEGTYEGREVRLGPRAGDYYLVAEGLREGELVVTEGGFKIDSAVQIQAKPSMMNPEGGAAPVAHHGGGAREHATEAAEPPLTVPESFRSQIDRLFTRYFAIHAGLSQDQSEAARMAATEFSTALSAVDMTLLAGVAHTIWMSELPALQRSASEIASADDITAARVAFAPLSDAMTRVARRFGSGDAPVLGFHCPMAFDGRGADWLQDHSGVENPYYGAVMYRCGTETGAIAPSAGASAGTPSAQPGAAEPN